eukprot:TRINITY_DN32327_c0_g1_i2.p1 TRINITY_DN32327_c0_g1~~TRINITY_DN32327_c0_g1_i2.p1  ORF type:complete len:226 (+),score=31.43 TRINITY_DN32327_c0_g1_i2:76-753(+)
MVEKVVAGKREDFALCEQANKSLEVKLGGYMACDESANSRLVLIDDSYSAACLKDGRSSASPSSCQSPKSPPVPRTLGTRPFSHAARRLRPALATGLRMSSDSDSLPMPDDAIGQQQTACGIDSACRNYVNASITSLPQTVMTLGLQDAVCSMPAGTDAVPSEEVPQCVPGRLSLLRQLRRSRPARTRATQQKAGSRVETMQNLCLEDLGDVADISSSSSECECT